MSKRNLILVIAIVAMVSVGAFAAFAQDDDSDNDAFPWMMHHGTDGAWGPGSMMGNFDQMGGFGMMGMFDEDHAMHTVLAELFGIDEETLYTEMHSGKTLEELAEEYDVDYQTIEDAMSALHDEHLAEMVAAGDLTQEQADLMGEFMQEFGAGFMGGIGHMGNFDRTERGSMRGHDSMRGHRGMRGDSDFWNNDSDNDSDDD
jgi:hypothetical protein